MELTAGKWLLLYICGMSLVTFLLYAADKSRAKSRAWRIPERVLLGCALLGGAPGGLLAMLTVRHKTAHWYFWTVCLLACAGWMAAVLKLITGIN